MWNKLANLANNNLIKYSYCKDVRTDMKNVIIVGAGIGGLCSAIRLLNRGCKVTILEKENTIGGVVNIKEGEGFSFDLTASIVMTPDIYTEIFKSVGKNYEDYIELIKLDPIYKVNYYDDTNYEFYSDFRDMSISLEKLQEGLSQEYMNFLFKSLNKYMMTKENFLTKPMAKVGEIITPSVICKAIKMRPLKSTDKYLSSLITNEKFKNYLMFQAMYMGIDPYKTSNLYSMIPTICHIYGLYYIKGGMYSYIKALEKLIIEMGGKIERNVNVKEIMIESNEVIGVEAGEKIYRADTVICNADFPYAIRNLFRLPIDEGNLYSTNYIEKKKCSCSVFMIYLGLKKKYDTLRVHNIYINQYFKDELEAPFMGELPEHPALYLYYPSAIDDTLCPKGKTVLNIMVRVPNLQCGKQMWDDETISSFRNKVMNQVRRVNGLQDIEYNIEYEDYLTPLQMKDKFNCYCGSAFGLSHKLTQSIYLRPHMKSKKIKGLYFVGASTHPGNGVSIITEGTKLLSDMVMNEEYE